MGKNFSGDLVEEIITVTAWNLHAIPTGSIAPCVLCKNLIFFMRIIHRNPTVWIFCQSIDSSANILTKRENNLTNMERF